MRTHVHRFRVIYGDTDMMGVVYYANYFRYFEAGRSEFLRAAGLTYSDLEARGFGLPVVSASAKYVTSAKYEDLLALTTEVRRLRFGSLEMVYKLHREADRALIATGETVHACVGASGRVVRLPDDLRERLSEDC